MKAHPQYDPTKTFIIIHCMGNVDSKVIEVYKLTKENNKGWIFQDVNIPEFGWNGYYETPELAIQAVNLYDNNVKMLAL